MSTLLRLDSSINGDASVSRRLTGQLVSQLSTADTKVITRDLSQGLSAIDGSWLAAVYTPADARTPEQIKTAAFADALLQELRDADTLVIGLPIYNFNVPAQLKIWIDMMARRGETFEYTDKGPRGLLSGKKAYVALASGGTTLGGPVDFASGWLRHVLGFMGITDVTFIAADQVAINADESVAQAETAIQKIAA